MANWLENQIQDPLVETACEWKTKYNNTLDLLVILESEVIKKEGTSQVVNFLLEHLNATENKKVSFDIGSNGINLGYNTVANTFIGALRIANPSGDDVIIYPVDAKTGYFDGESLIAIGSLGDREFVAKKHLTDTESDILDLIDEVDTATVKKSGSNLLTGFTMRHATTDPDRFMYISFDVSGINFGIMDASGSVVSKFTFSALSRLAPDASTKFGYLSDSELRSLSSIDNKEFVAKQHLTIALDSVTGENPSLLFASGDLLRSYNIIKNLNISATSLTATITIDNSSVGLGQVLSCYIVNSSSNNVAITISCPSNIKYPQNLDTGITRSGDQVTISANKQYLITFLRSKENTWSFNILEQND